MYKWRFVSMLEQKFDTNGLKFVSCWLAIIKCMNHYKFLNPSFKIMPHFMHRIDAITVNSFMIFSYKHSHFCPTTYFDENPMDSNLQHVLYTDKTGFCIQILIITYNMCIFQWTHVYLLQREKHHHSIPQLSILIKKKKLFSNIHLFTFCIHL